MNDRDLDALRRQSMREKVIWSIRDARDLSALEKVFLMVVESRGVTFSSAFQNAEDMGMSRAQYHRVRNDLVEKGLLIATPSPLGTTLYAVRSEAVDSYSVVSHTETQVSHTETRGVSHRDHKEDLEVRPEVDAHSPSNYPSNVIPIDTAREVVVDGREAN